MENKQEDMTTKMKDLLNLTELESVLNSNEKEFEVDGVTYRVIRPTHKQRQEAYQKRITKYSELLKDKNYMLESDLKKLYDSRGIDTDEMLKTIKTKSDRRDKLMIQLGEALTTNASDTELNSFKDEISILNSEIQDISIKRTMLFEVSLEQQVLIHTISYLTFLIVEKKDGENWIKAWNTYEEFENCSDKLINRSTYYVTLIAGTQDI